MTVVEEQRDDGVRVYLPLLDGSDEVGVLALTLDTVDDDDRRLLRRLASLVADTLVTKNAYTDQFFQARRRAPITHAHDEMIKELLAGQTQWCQGRRRGPGPNRRGQWRRALLGQAPPRRSGWEGAREIQLPSALP
jgi:hypothetical protein